MDNQAHCPMFRHMNDKGIHCKYGNPPEYVKPIELIHDIAFRTHFNIRCCDNYMDCRNFKEIERRLAKCIAMYSTN